MTVLATERTARIAAAGGHLDLALLERPGPGPAVVLVHGGGRTILDWLPTITRLDESLHVVALELRGHGQSAAVDSFAFADGVADIAGVVDSLGLDRPFIVGHSLGGMLALGYGAQHGACRGVVNIDGFGRGIPREFDGIDAEEVARAQAVFQERSEEEFARAHDQGDALWVEQQVAEARSSVEVIGLDWDVVEPHVRRLYRSLGNGIWEISPNVRVNASMYRSLADIDIWPWLQSMDCPTLVIRANSDIEEQADGDAWILRLLQAYERGVARLLSESLEANPNVRVEHIDSDHMVPLSHPAELVDHLHAFFHLVSQPTAGGVG